MQKKKAALVDLTFNPKWQGKEAISKPFSKQVTSSNHFNDTHDFTSTDLCSNDGNSAVGQLLPGLQTSTHDIPYQLTNVGLNAAVSPLCQNFYSRNLMRIVQDSKP